MTGPGRPFDPGLQVERTLLAWRRTCLALAVANVVAIRYLFEALGPIAAALGLAGLALSIVTWIACTVRYRRTHAGLIASDRVIPDGTLPLLLAIGVGIAALAALLIVVALWHP